MNYIMNHQSAVKAGQDILLIDGLKSEYSGSSEQKEAMAYLNSSRYGNNYSFMKNFVSGCSSSLSIRVGNDGEGVLVESHFISKDDSGRKIPYWFWMRNIASPAAVKWTIEDAAKQLGMQVNPSDTEAVSMALRVGSKVKMTGVAAAVVVVAIILIIIL